VKPLGVGLIFVKELLPLLREGNEAVSVVEIEPQTLWQLSRSGGRDGYAPNEQLYDALAELPQPKLLHSVGLPVGSSRSLEPAQTDLLRTMVGLLEPAWASEHLSFNAFADGERWSSVGFLLPPLQCPETVSVASAKLRALGDALALPIAFETGVNYLQPQPDELPDGDFFAAVANTADCGIVVDLHNLWANELNGRPPARDVLARLPLERVWELHLAGGMPFGGRWLDAHSGAIPDPVLALAAEWVPQMPNLGALIFEIMGEHVATLGLDGVARQVESMRSLWPMRPAAPEIRVHRPAIGGTIASPREVAAVRAWECALGGVVIGREVDNQLGSRLRSDHGIPLFQQLVADARTGFVADGLHYTTSLLLCAWGSSRVRELLIEFMRSRPPELFVSAEADAFAGFLRERALPIPYLDEVLAFEHALVRAALYGESSTVTFAHEPTALFESLEQGRLPGDAACQPTALAIRVG
jgi:uncharacterized protein (UPF0276 family)